MPSARASRVAWMAPAPPPATSVKRRGSMPRSSETARIADTMFDSTTRTMPAAARTVSRPSGPAMCVSIAARGQVGAQRPAAAEEGVRSEGAEHHVGVGDRRLGAARVVAGGAGPGTRRCEARRAARRRHRPRRCCRRRRRSSDTSTPGTPTGWSSTRMVRDTTARPSWMRQTSRLVPPMSIVIRSPSPSRRAWCSAAAGAAAGPDASTVTGAREDVGDRRAAAVDLHDQRRPVEALRRRAAARAGAGSRRSRAARRRSARSPTCAPTRGSRAARRSTAAPRRRAAPAARISQARSSCSALAIDHRNATATACTPASRNVRGRRADGGLVERSLHLAARPDALGHADAQVARHERLGMRQADVEALGLVAVAEVEDVAEPLGAEQPDGRPGALDQDVGGDRRAVHEQVGATEQRTTAPRPTARPAPSGPAAIARTGSSGVESSFHSRCDPSSPSTVKSVNVPPMSTPMRRRALTAGSGGRRRRRAGCAPPTSRPTASTARTPAGRPRAAARAAAAVAAASTWCPSSSTTPNTRSAASRETMPSRTSRATSPASRSVGSP